MNKPENVAGCTPCRGRPREFCVDAALAQALRVFWEKGYEGTSLNDLTEAMGITRPSLYAAFGNKDALFRKALDLYETEKLAYIRQALAEHLVLRHGAVHRLHHQEDGEGDDQEVDQRVDEGAVVEGGRAGLLGGGERRVLSRAQHQEQVREVDAAEQLADGRHQHVAHERAHDLAEGAADDHADGQIEDVAAQRELLELFSISSFLFLSL